ncbi:Kin of IRRE-like protein 1 [Holothuria leucospilota]|uniref:Kin of IRRE-like protein 1 n=1 Tax=Holothuria leucospilota TaxID=206669 RepID=A0A9Q0YLC8_HOLLE|nr:Kin of IRRE-like protein 1 [Holothuria leucospilota]
MADDSSYNIVVLQILVVSIVFRIESIAQCQDENDLKKLHETTAVGSSVELACNITNPEFASWLGEDQGGLTLGFIVYSRWRNSYSLRTVSTANVSNYFLYKLVVHNVTEDVEGFYLCQEEGCQKAKINLTVEVPPVLWLEREHSNISNIINVTLNQETDIRCKAVGGKPTVSLLWEINGEDETDGVTSETTPNEVTSTLNYKPNIDDRMVTCKSSGQIAVPSLRTSVNINVLYPPTCHILVNKDSTSTYKVTCVCVANPEVSLSVLIVNNFPYESDTVSLPVTLSAKIYCRAENGVGVCESPVHTHTPLVTPTALPIETNQPLNEQSTSFLKHPLPILLVISTTIMITATALTVAIVMKKRSSTTECNRTSTESQNISCSMYDQFQPVSKHGFIDTSDCRYETRFFREGIAVICRKERQNQQEEKLQKGIHQST